jgi:hypothetical protein
MENPELMLGVPLILLSTVGLLVVVELVIASSGRASGASRVGLMVFAGLAWLTMVEYLVAVATSYNMVLLTIIAVLKTGLIMQFFMHVMRVRKGASGGH